MSMYTRICTVLLPACLIAMTAAAAAEKPSQYFSGPGPSGVITLANEPYVTVGIWTEPIAGGGGDTTRKLVRFEATGGLWDVDGLDRLHVWVEANDKWRVTAQASDLTGDAGMLPASRLTAALNSSPQQYRRLDVPIEVKSGNNRKWSEVEILLFRAHIEPADRAGTYHGTIQFTGLLTP